MVRGLSSKTGIKVSKVCPSLYIEGIGTDMEYKAYMCVICGYIYEEEKGVPEDGIEPGTRWEDIPPNWTCPECGARKEDFEMVEI